MKEESIQRYLLGDLSEQEQEEIETRYIDDKEFFERLLVVEDELIDACASGRLSGRESEHFERHFLRSADRRQRLEFARPWMTYVSRPSAKPAVRSAQRSFWRRGERAPLRTSTRAFLIPLAATLLLALGGMWFVIQTGRLNNQLAQKAAVEEKNQELRQQLDDERRRSEQLVAELGRERIKPAPEGRATIQPAIVSLILSSGFVRGGGDMPRLVIPTGTKQVRLQANFRGDDHKSFSAVLETAEGTQVWKQSGLKARSKGRDKIVVLTLPASVFRDQDYVLTVSAVASTGELESVGDYSFRVVRK